MNKRKPIKVEVFIAPDCDRCRDATQGLKEITEKIGRGRIEWREVNVIDELDYAVKLGVLGSLAIAIDGRLAFATLPSMKAFRGALNARLEETGA